MLHLYKSGYASELICRRTIFLIIALIKKTCILRCLLPLVPKWLQLQSKAVPLQFFLIKLTRYREFILTFAICLIAVSEQGHCDKAPICAGLDRSQITQLKGRVNGVGTSVESAFSHWFEIFSMHLRVSCCILVVLEYNISFFVMCLSVYA
jgi:hypothetical protein